MSGLTEKHLSFTGKERLAATGGQPYVWVFALAVVAVCIIRYAMAPSFWLDEAHVALTLRNPSLDSIFGRLERGFYFPRLYLTSIAALREVFGYQIWVLRLLPSLCFVIGTLFWARLLAKRSRQFSLLGLLGGALLIGSTFWLNQSINLKHYTFEVMLSLIPFLLDDRFFKESLVDGRRRSGLALLTIPCFLTYTYPMTLGARVLGWYIYYGRSKGWRINLLSVCLLFVLMASGLVGIWATDYRFGPDLTGYWNDCFLRTRLKGGVGSALSLIADFIWGWHPGRLQPFVVASVAPLQVLGLYSLLSRLKNRDADSDEHGWGARSFGSLVLLPGTILASAVVNYPICAGRLMLFTQIHTQILAIEGGLFVLTFWGRRKSALFLLNLSIGIVLLYSVHRYVVFVQEGPYENIRPMLSLIRPEVSDTVWVHPCSVAQVKSLPYPLPVEHVLLNTRKQLPQPGKRVWILWTHMSDFHCRERFDEVRARALSWQTVHEGLSRGLALAEF
jgi:hypothetical protein